MRGYLRTTERPRDSEVRGIRVARWSKRMGADSKFEYDEIPGSVWMFPGSDRQSGLALAGNLLPDSVLRAADVSVEFGTMRGRDWQAEEIVKAHSF